MLVTQTVSTPRTNLKGFDRRQSVDKAPLVAVYATQQGKRFNVWVVSRQIPGYPEAGHSGHSPVLLNLPFRSSSKLIIHRMTGPFDAHNLHARSVRVETIALPNGVKNGQLRVDERTGASPAGLPPASVFLYVFEDVTM